jgi:serine/threonine kinase 19
MKENGLEKNKFKTSRWFSVPVCGKFTIQILEGRKEILKILKRKKFKEMLLKNLMKFKLKNSTLPISFHIRDLSVTGFVNVTQTTSGSLISISK